MTNDEKLIALEEYLNDLRWNERKSDDISTFVSNQIGIPCDVKISPFKRKIDLVFHPDENTDIRFYFSAAQKYCGREEINGKLSITFKI